MTGWFRNAPPFEARQALSDFLPRHFHCDDVEILTARMKEIGLDLELLQVQPGPFHADCLLVPLEHLQLSRIRLSSPLLSLGSKPCNSFAISLSLDPLQSGPLPLQSHGEDLPEHAIYGLDPGREVHLLTPQGYGMVLLRVDQRVLLELAESLGCPELESPFRQHNWLRLDPSRLEELRVFLIGLFQLAERQPEFLAALAQRRQLASDLVPLLLEALIDSIESHRGTRREPARIDLVKQVEGWARANPTTPITLEQLCCIAYASRRSLMRGFREHLGMGPMAFLKLRRLHGVHAALLRHEPEAVMVQDLAAHWGFHNAGHFARDYRRHFGELPLQTLRRAPVS
jgi:AraC family ethanolamine operon transcriptional activator